MKTVIKQNTLLVVLILCISFNLFGETYTVINTDDAGAGSLREAINNANSNAGDDIIVFNISGAAPHTIHVISGLPTLTDANTTIDGTTQPANGYTGLSPHIILLGTGIPSGGNRNGITITADNCKVYGLFIRGFGHRGIEIENVNGFEIGLANKINIISANEYHGIEIINSSNGIIAYNNVGLDETGANAMSNGYYGINLEGVSNIEIRDNLISGNNYGGIAFRDNYGQFQNDNCIIKRNKIGTDNTGNNALPNHYSGISLKNSIGFVIGGTSIEDANIIAFNLSNGINLESGYNNSFRQNSIFENNGGISLENNSNNNYQAPVINTITANDISGTSQGNAIIELFYSETESSCQGKTYFATVTADASGNWSYSGNLTQDIVVATATSSNVNGNTSEFSNCATISNTYLSVSTSNINLNSEINSYETFDISSNTEWTITTNVNWLSLNQNSENNNATIMVTATSANNSSSERTAIITVSGNNVNSQEITVIQNGQNSSSECWEILNTSNTNIPDNDLYAIHIDNSNIFWIGSQYNGVTRYDGTNWINYNTSNSALPNNYVRTIIQDLQENIWVTNNSAYGLSKFDGNSWVVFTTSNSQIPSDFIYCDGLFSDNQNSLWICTDNGLAKLQNDTWTIYNTSNSDLPSNNVTSIIADNQDNKWIATDNGLAMFDGNNWEIYNSANSGIIYDNISGITIDDLNNIWLYSSNQLIKFDGINWDIYDLNNFTSEILNIDTHSNNILLGTRTGVIIYDGTNFINYNSSNSDLPTNEVRGIEIDYNNDMWIATDGGGLAKFSCYDDLVSIKKIEIVNHSIYPNPTSEKLYINIPNKLIGRIEIYNLFGRVVYNNTINSSFSEIDISNQKSGIYIVKLQIDNKIVVEKIVIE